MTRSEIRKHIFKIIFRLEFNKIEEMEEQLKFYFHDDIKVSEEEKIYINDKANDIISKCGEIDKQIENVSANWKIGRIAKVDIAILRVAIYEILYDDDIPTGVAINEAVELAKRYSGEEAGQFVNGILAQIGN